MNRCHPSGALTEIYYISADGTEGWKHLQHYILCELISDQILVIRVAAEDSPTQISHVSRSKDVMFKYYFSKVKAGHMNRTWVSSHNQLFYKPSNHQNSVQLRPGDNIRPQSWDRSDGSDHSRGEVVWTTRVLTDPTSEPAPDSINKCGDFKSYWVKTNFINSVKLVLHHLDLLVNSANVLHELLSVFE